MDNGIQSTFDKIHAETDLKKKTTDFLHEKIRRKSGGRVAIRFRLATVCFSFVMLFILSSLSVDLYFTPSAYVDIDVNPSIELSVNRFGRVIEASPYNDDGATILHGIRVQHLSYGDAVEKLIGTMTESGYLKQDGMVSVTVQAYNESKENNMLGSLRSTIDTTLRTHHTNAATDVFAVSEEIRSYAHVNHMTPAKYLAISQLQQVDPTATYEGCRMHSIGEINTMIQEHGRNHHGRMHH